MEKERSPSLSIENNTNNYNDILIPDINDNDNND